MKSFRGNQLAENKSNELSLGDLSRVKLPRLQKPPKKLKKPILKGSSRLDSTPSKYDQLVDEILELQNCVSKKYGKSIKVESLRKMQKSISSLNQEISLVNRNLSSQSAKEPAVRSTSSSESDDLVCAATKEVDKWSRRLQFRRRLEMANRNLIVINFEGVIGDIFKHDIWHDAKETLHIRKGAIKGLKELRANFQIVLFFHTTRVSHEKVINFLASKSVFFDAVYISENSSRWALKSQGRFKKPLKYSEHVQNYSQIAVDFGLQHEVLGKMLILTSIWLDHDEHFGANLSLIIKNFSCIPQYLCKAVPVLSNPDMLLPITLAVPDPRIANEGNSFEDIIKVIKALIDFATIDEECSWLDGYARIRADPQMNSVAFESTAYQYALAKEKIEVSIEQVASYSNQVNEHCVCPNELKNNCRIKEFGRCSSQKKMKGYFIMGKEFPSSMLKNKFIVHKIHNTFPYKKYDV